MTVASHPSSERAIAPCTEACPAGVDVPRYLRYIREGRFDEALATLRERIPFPSVCGYACYAPCEVKCARRQLDEPIAIRALHRTAAEEGGESWKERAKAAPRSGKRVAVVGSGPCGLTAAYYLARRCHGVTVFEALPEPGGMMRYCIPEYRLPKDVLNKEIEEIRAVGVEIRTNSPVERLEDLFEEGYDAILVACGAWQKSKMEIEGEYFAVDGISFLKAVNSGERPKVGKRVIVVGGGNTAVDAARSCVRLGASDVCIVYRRTREEMPASDEEVQAALEEGVRLEFLAAPVQIQKREGGFTLLCRRMKLGPKDASGRPVPVPVEGSEFAMDCDTVISAIGQSVRIPSLFGLRIVEGRVEADPNTLETGVRGVFAAGDAVTGPSSIIEAIAQGRRAASSIDKFLGGDGEIDEVLAQGESAASYEVTMAKTHRPYMPTIPLGRRLCSFECVELGYGPSAGVKEASRCLDCDLRRFSVEVDGSACKDCGYCAEVCRLEVFSHANYFNERGYRPYVAVHPERCIGCLACFYACPDFAISVVRRR